MSNKSLTLSIVIPAYNEQDYLPGCLDSIAKQTHAPLQVVVVDNNSVDKTVQIATKYPFVTLLTESRQGIVFARNRAFNAAKADIIGRIDADTHLNPDWVHQTLDYLTKNPNVAAVTGDCYFYDFPFYRFLHRIHKFMYYILQRWIAGTDILWGSNMAIRASAWHKVKNIVSTEPNMHEDIDLSLKLKSGKIRIRHVNKMKAEVSLRRGDLGIRSLNRYLSAWHHTYVLNKMYIRGVFILLLEIITLAAAVLFWPFHRLVK